MFPLVEVRGTPYEIGFQHGQAAGKKIDNTIRLYKFVFKNLWGVEWEAAVKDSSRFVKYVQDYDTDLVEEMQGVADGADKSFEEILTVNARSEVIFSGHTLEGCTSIDSGAKTRPKSCFFHQNGLQPTQFPSYGANYG